MTENENIISKTYEPKAVEEKWARIWLESGANAPVPGTDKPCFSMVIPPPNITGALHLGHALNSTLQDILARYKRMKGFNVLWLPGIDHAGIATQNVVERQLAADDTTRHELGRDEFVKRVWQWKEESGGTIIKQLKRLGASCDWSRQRFTMDEGLSKAVREVFTTLYKEGLIYRGDYIINWCPRCHTALSDLEVNFTETDGSLWHMVYPLKEPVAGMESLTVATTRPETMLGDTAVAVNPDDERYKGLIGKHVKLPLANRDIPIIGDESVSVEFGTGVVKITPAHDFNDFDVSRRHNLPSVNVMDINGKMNEAAGAYAGLDRFKARKKIVADLEELGLLKQTDKHKLMLGSCYRCSTVVEPTLSKQWFVKVGPLAEPAIKAVEDGRTRFVPKGWENTYFDWMRNIRDWCISRQIWWGHRIPAWHCADCPHITVGTTDPASCEACGSKNIAQDSDVLDTWFSSALWPFSTLGWPDKTDDLSRFYPTSALSTSFDIIFFWVARMMMMGLKCMGDVPFKDVYIHALIRDAEGQKMSKSKGNVIDPLVMMDTYGTDAFRFTLAILAAQGRDIKLAEERIGVYRNFANKIWNLTRFAQMNIEGMDPAQLVSEPEAGALGMADKWILTRRSICVTEVSEAIETYRFDEAARSLYRFVWHEVCDWYVELSKLDLKGDNGPERKMTSATVLVAVLKDIMKMLHPFMPFITEEIYSSLPPFGKGESGGFAGSLMTAEFPQAEVAYIEETVEIDDAVARPGTKTVHYRFDAEAAEMELVMDVIRAVRNIRTDMNVALDARVECICMSDAKTVRDAIMRNDGYIKLLAKAASVSALAPCAPPKGAASGRASGAGHTVEVYVPLAGHIDLEIEEKRVAKELEKLIKELDGVTVRLANPSFADKAPIDVVEKERVRQAALVEKKVKLDEAHERIIVLKSQSVAKVKD
ncbi:MAG: valine--tRNA ligase [Deltaproteobacteria bacterium]|nr:valine--tRNA ligase [Deltaproteobacteria bacterium]